MVIPAGAETHLMARDISFNSAPGLQASNQETQRYHSSPADHGQEVAVRAPGADRAPIRVVDIHRGLQARRTKAARHFRQL